MTPRRFKSDIITQEAVDSFLRQMHITGKPTDNPLDLLAAMPIISAIARPLPGHPIRTAEKIEF